MKMKIYDSLKSIDKFSHELNLKANKSDTHSTCLTLICTFAVSALFLAYFPNKMYKYITDRPYNLNAVLDKIDRLEIKPFEPKNMQMVIITNELQNTQARGDEFVSTEASAPIVSEQDNGIHMESYVSSEDGKLTLKVDKLGSVQRCASSPELNEVYNSFFLTSSTLSDSINQSYCINPSKSAKIGGLYFGSGEQNFTVIRSAFQMTYDEEKQACPYLKRQSYYSLVYKNYIADYDNRENPIKETIYNHNELFGGHNEILIKVRLRKTAIITDSNLFGDFFENTIHEFYSVHYISDQKMNLIDKDKVESKEGCQTKLQIYFEIDDNVLKVHREYEKLDNFIANTTGFIGFIVSFIKVLANFLERSVFEQKLSRRMYSRDFKLKFSKCSTSFDDRLSKNSLKSTKSTSKIIGERKKDKCKLFNMWKPSNLQLFSKKAVRYLEHDCDLLTIMRKILLFEALIKVLLTDEQLKLLNLVNVRKISEEMDMDKQIKQLEERFPMPGKMDGVVAQVDDIPGDDYLTSRILEEIEES